MALTALALCSRALIKIGAQPIASLDEGTAEAEVAANLYPATRDAMLSLHPLHCAQQIGPSNLCECSACCVFGTRPMSFTFTPSYQAS